jgi:hypothetical protein
MKSFGMRIFDVKKVTVHGESFQIHAAKEDSCYTEQETVARIRAEEARLSLDNVCTYFSLAKEIQKRRIRLQEMLARIKAEGKHIVGYGAPAKGNMLLNHCGLDSKIIDYVVDTTTSKQGLFTPGSHIPICSPERLLDDTPDYILLLAWNYADAILEKEQSLRARGTKFIIPVPKIATI